MNGKFLANTRPEISVIIPIYNTAKYLAECLDSVLAQTFSDFEIICINDGSTDDSPKILARYHQQDSRIIIIDQQNAGVSAARNAGLQKAVGKYIAFVDSDDTVAPDFISTLYKVAEKHNADVVYSNMLGENFQNISQPLVEKSDFSAKILPVYFKNDQYNSVCNKLYSSHTIRGHKPKFSVRKTHAEDAEFNIRFLIHAERIYFCNYSGYHYRDTPDSATRNPIKHPYLQNAVDIFLRDWTPVIGNLIEPEIMHQLKKERLINNIISQIYIYGNAGNGLPFRLRWQKLQKIVSHPVITRIFRENNGTITADFPSYKRQVYLGILRQSVITLYLLTQYSYYRNR